MEELIKHLIKRLDEIDSKLKNIEEKISQSEIIASAQEETKLYEKAEKLAMELGGLDVGLLENKLHIGEARAEKLIDKLEANGIIDPYLGNEDFESISN